MDEIVGEFTLDYMGPLLAISAIHTCNEQRVVNRLQRVLGYDAPKQSQTDLDALA